MLEIAWLNASEHIQRRWMEGDLRIASQPADAANRWLLGGEQAQTIEFDVRAEVVDNSAAVLITNHGQSLMLSGGRRIAPGVTQSLSLPVKFWAGRTQFQIAAADSELPHDVAFTAFPRMSEGAAEFSQAMKQLGGAPSATTVAQWFHALTELQQAVAGSRQCAEQAAFALFDPGGLDGGMILLREADEWTIAASYIAAPVEVLQFRRSLVEAAATKRCTLFHDARRLAGAKQGRAGEFVVAAPILDSAGDVMGMVYGLRVDHANNHRRGIRPLEAQFTQAVSDTVSAAYKRLTKEAEAAKLRAQLEQVFSPALARSLDANPQWLEGCQREVTVLFCDIRGFTSLSEYLSPREAFSLVSDAMDRFTSIVSRHDGVVIDYFGDGFAAFWNAPTPQPRHAQLACQAALDLQLEATDWSADWLPLTGRHLRIGVGIHTGPALVGNAGSATRIKYGPRGATVNIASRVEGATKAIGIPVLISQATAHQLPTDFPCRRVFRQALPGVDQPVDLYQPLTSGQAAKLVPIASQWQHALAKYEAHDNESAMAIIDSLIVALGEDAAVEHLRRRLLDRRQACDAAV